MGPFARVMLAAAVGAASPAVAAAQAAGDSAPAGSAEPPAKAVVPATGYSYRGPTPPLAERAHARAPARADAPASSGPDAQMPGFETLASGGTRLFVALSKAVEFDARAGHATITYVLKGAHVERRNDQNPLVTLHFNTPVTSARLVPHGRDVWFVVDLRASVQPTVSLGQAKDGAA